MPNRGIREGGGVGGKGGGVHHKVYHESNISKGGGVHHKVNHESNIG